MPDQIFLRDHIVEAEIGAFSEERGQVQRLAFSIYVDVPGGGDVGDDVDQILSYDVILGAIEAEIAITRVDLLETLAEGIAARILGEPLALKVRISIEKLDRVSGRLGIEIEREAAPAHLQGATSERPVVHCLGKGQMIGALESGAHIILVEGEFDELLEEPAIARRLAMLASEQAGWKLAVKLNGVHVVATRTELEHAIKEKRTVIWAPAKLVFDAPEGIASVPQEFAQLAVWFAEQIQAREVRFWGLETPEPEGFEGALTQGPLA